MTERCGLIKEKKNNSNNPKKGKDTDVYIEHPKEENVCTGDILFFYAHSPWETEAKTEGSKKKKKEEEEHREDGEEEEEEEEFVDVPLSERDRSSASLLEDRLGASLLQNAASSDAQKKNVEYPTVRVEPASKKPLTSFVFVRLRKTFVDTDLNNFMIKWMFSNEVRALLTGEITNDAVVAHTYLRTHFKNKLCEEVLNASRVEDEYPPPYGLLPDNRNTYVWGLPTPSSLIPTGEKGKKEGREISTACALGPCEGDGFRRLIPFDSFSPGATSFQGCKYVGIRKMNHHDTQPLKNDLASKGNDKEKKKKKDVKKEEEEEEKEEEVGEGEGEMGKFVQSSSSPDLPRSAPHEFATSTCSTTCTYSTSFGRIYNDPSISVVRTRSKSSANDEKIRKTIERASSRRPAPRPGTMISSHSSSASSSAKPKKKKPPSWYRADVLKKIHTYHALICDFMLDRAYALKYEERCKRIKKDMEPVFPSLHACFCSWNCGCDDDKEEGGGGGSSSTTEKVYYNPISTSEKDRRKFAPLDEEYKEDEKAYSTAYIKKYNEKIHGPWITTGGTLASAFAKKNASAFLQWLDVLFVSRSLMTVYYDFDPRRACLSPRSAVATVDGAIALNDDSRESQVRFARGTVDGGVTHGPTNAGSGESTPRERWVDRRGSLTITPNQEDIEVEITETLPYTRTNTLRRIKKIDLINELEHSVTTYEKYRRKSELEASVDLKGDENSVVRLANFKPWELGTDFLLSETKPCAF